MPLTPDVVGLVTDPVEHTVDARWLMAYAAAVGAVGPAYLDTARPAGIVGHPIFPVCLEWPAVLAVRDQLAAQGLERAEAARGVHLTHALHAHRPVRAGDRLRTTARVTAVDGHRAGALVVLELTSVDDRDEPVAVTTMGTLYRGVAIAGADVADPSATGRDDSAPAPDDAPHDATDRFTIDVPAGAAHVYSECSRIWNPIHTDARTAARAGLPGIILHGTATLGMVVTRVVAHHLDDDPSAVTDVAVRFGAMVAMPSRLDGRAWAAPDATGRHGFTVDGPAGEPVLRGGWLLGSRPC